MWMSGGGGGRRVGGIGGRGRGSRLVTGVSGDDEIGRRRREEGA